MVEFNIYDGAGEKTSIKALVQQRIDNGKPVEAKLEFKCLEERQERNRDDKRIADEG